MSNIYTSINRPAMSLSFNPSGVTKPFSHSQQANVTQQPSVTLQNGHQQKQFSKDEFITHIAANNFATTPCRIDDAQFEELFLMDFSLSQTKMPYY